MKKIYTLIVSVFLAGTTLAQDIHFSQYWENPILVNPANTGLIPADLRLAMNYRNQWSSVASPYKTFSFNGDYLYKTKGTADLGFGLNIVRDVAGDTKFSTTDIQFAVSSILSLDDYNEISIGIRGGFMQKSMSPADLIWGNQYQNGTYNAGADPGENLLLDGGMKGDISAGIAYVYHTSDRYMTANDEFNMRLGFSYNHINKPKHTWTDITTDTLYSNFIGSAQFLIGMPNSRLSILPSFLFMKQGPSKEIMFGSLFRYRLQDAAQITGFIKGAYLSLGAHIRLKDAIVPTLLLEFDKYAIGASYDLNISSLRTASGMRGGFEVTLRFQTPNPYLFKGSAGMPSLR
jgi:type IX secretion system PorP/SprF family membrane protein